MKPGEIYLFAGRDDGSPPGKVSYPLFNHLPLSCNIDSNLDVQIVERLSPVDTFTVLSNVPHGEDGEIVTVLVSRSGLVGFAWVQNIRDYVKGPQ